MALDYRITKVTSKAGTEVELPVAGVTCVVGGNNVGKSQFLREVFSLAYDSDTSGLVILKDGSAHRPTGTIEETLAWLEARTVRYDHKPGDPTTYASRIGDLGTSLRDFYYWIDQDESEDPYLGNIARFFVEYAAAGTLSTYASGYVDPNGGGTNYALMRLRGSGDLEEELSSVIREAFGVGVVLDRLDLQTRLRVGDVSADVPPLNRPTKEYADQLAQLPLLDNQGDGFRSFVGIASHVLTHQFTVLLIDEPEAFLHPGQARILGRWLANQATLRDMQIILATHDKDLLIGLLDAADDSNVNLVRLARRANETTITQVDPADVSDVWRNPVLRYSNALQGLFHSKVIVCEGDADCRFYAAAVHSAATLTGQRALSDDTLFVPAAGKGGIPAALQAIARLGVEAWTFPDFDVLKNKSQIRNIVVANGGTWTATMDESYTLIARSLNQHDRWDAAKEMGLEAIPAGEPYAAALDLLAELTAARVRLVPRGEMESFGKHITGHSSDWVFEALSEGIHQSADVAAYVQPVIAVVPPNAVQA